MQWGVHCKRILWWFCQKPSVRNVEDVEVEFGELDLTKKNSKGNARGARYQIRIERTAQNVK